MLLHVQGRQTMIHIGSAHEFWARGKDANNFFIAFLCNNFSENLNFGKIEFRKTHGMVKFWKF